MLILGNEINTKVAKSHLCLFKKANWRGHENMITDFVKMWITEDQSFTLLFFIGKFFNQSWPYMCSTTVIKITHHWSLFLELRGNNCIYTRSGYPLICKYWRDVGLCSVWNLILLVNSPSNMKFTIIWTLLHSSVLPLHFLGNRAFEKIWSLKSGSKKEYLYRHTHLDSLPSSSNNTIAVKSTNPTATATGAYAANVVRHCW